MEHTKVIKRSDGTQYQIQARIFIETYQNKMRYETNVWTKNKGQKKWRNLPDAKHDYEIRSLSMEERTQHKNNNQLRFVTAQEIHQTEIELWEKIKPTK